MTIESAIASSGRAVSDRAAAGGPIIRLKISNAPTTGRAMLVARATTTRNAVSVRFPRIPRASPRSELIELSSSGRYSSTTAARLAAASAATGATDPAAIPRIWPKSSA